MNKISIIFVISLLITGCAATPEIRSDSIVSKKIANFPEPSKVSIANKNSLVLFGANYESKHIYKLAKPVQIGLMLGSVKTDNETTFNKAILKGKAAYCSKDRVYIDPLTGPHSIACFYGTTDKVVDTVTAAPGAVWFDKKLNDSVEVVQTELPVQTGNVLKRELYYVGSNGNTILFNLKIYDKSIEVPSSIRPLVYDVDKLPYLFDVEGAKININSYNQNELNYSVLSGWSF